MDIDRGLRIRITISVILAVILLAYFVERMSYRNPVAMPRGPASAERVIESCDEGTCLAPPAHDGEGTEIKAP